MLSLVLEAIYYIHTCLSSIFCVRFLGTPLISKVNTVSPLQERVFSDGFPFMQMGDRDFLDCMFGPPPPPRGNGKLAKDFVCYNKLDLFLI